MNLLIVTANLGKDAEQRFLPNGDSIVSFSLPVKSGFGDKAKTSWVRCSMFGKRGESVLPYLKKGTLVGVSGEFSMNEWTDKDGQKRTTPECRVAELTLLGGKPQGESATSTYAPKSSSAPSNSNGFEDMESDIPF